MKILLVDPPCYRFMCFQRYYVPTGLAVIAAVLREDGHDVLIYDADHDPNAISLTQMQASQGLIAYKNALTAKYHPVWNEFLEVFENFHPDVLGVSVLTSKVSSALRIVNIARESNPNIITVAGGDHVTVRPQDLLGQKKFEYAIRGEGEYTFRTLLKELQSNTSAVHNVLGLSWCRRSDGLLMQNPPAQLIKNLDELPLPAFDLIYKHETYRSLDWGLLITERGCPSKCTFCGLQTMWARTVRRHSVDRVLIEIKNRINTYGTKYFSFRNGTFTLSKPRVQELCNRLIEENLNIQWECLTRVDRIDTEIISLMRDAGCVTIRIGIESGSQRMLDYMRKEISLSDIIKKSKILNDSGIFWTAYFMLGIPQEDESSVLETLKLMKKMDAPFYSLAKFSPLPGTPMYNKVVRNGLIDENTTDWTWSLNQDLDQFFVTKITQKKMRSLMKKVMRFVDSHNAKKDSFRQDLRTK